MPISRRAFFGLSAGAVAGFALDPERLLWRPGARTILLPSPSQFRYYSTIVVMGLVQRGPRISPYEYSRAIGKQIVWADDGDRRIDVTFPWQDTRSIRLTANEIAPQNLIAVHALGHAVDRPSGIYRRNV